MRFDRRALIAAGGALVAASAAKSFSPASAGLDDMRTVVTRTGRIVGRREGDLLAFRGIPYAQPPVGARRFRPPEPLPASRQIIDAGGYGPAAMQPTVPGVEPVGRMSEDCLRLNIFAPASPGPHPVLFMVHGGGNFLGSGNQSYYDGTSFTRDGVIYVSFNYRLGAFGFMELGGVDPAYAGSGLCGLLDIAEALRWVRANIAMFGGDPENITLSGVSAGGKNECALASMPSVNRLFRRITVHSGGGLTVFRDAQAAKPVAEAVIAAAGVQPADVRGLVALSADALLQAQGKAMAALPLGYPFRPTVDGHLLPHIPVEAARRGLTRHIDVAIGTAREEAAGMLLPGRADKPLAARQVANVDMATMQALEADYARIMTDLSPADRRIRQLTAEEYWIPSIRFAEAHAGSGGRAWMYRFDWKSPTGPAAGYAPHGGDLPFLFDRPSSPRAPEGSGEAIARAFALWVNWTKTGAPAAAGLPDWPIYDAVSRRTLIFDRETRIVSDPDGAERRLWDGKEPGAA